MIFQIELRLIYIFVVKFYFERTRLCLRLLAFLSVITWFIDFECDLNMQIESHKNVSFLYHYSALKNSQWNESFNYADNEYLNRKMSWLMKTINVQKKKGMNKQILNFKLLIWLNWLWLINELITSRR